MAVRHDDALPFLRLSGGSCVIPLFLTYGMKRFKQEIFTIPAYRQGTTGEEKRYNVNKRCWVN